VINRFSSRLRPLDHSFLTERLRGARRYDRIAGFFSSSVLEVTGEEPESVEGLVRLVCNSVISTDDVTTAKKAAQAAMRREWCDAEPGRLPEAAKPRFQRLYSFLSTGKLQVRVIPDEKFGLIHGKAGVIALADGRRTAFLGSVNESLTAMASAPLPENVSRCRHDRFPHRGPLPEGEGEGDAERAARDLHGNGLAAELRAAVGGQLGRGRPLGPRGIRRPLAFALRRSQSHQTIRSTSIYASHGE
jgi:hypothetical protein